MSALKNIDLKMLKKIASLYPHIFSTSPTESLDIHLVVEKIVAYYEEIISCMPGNVYWFDNKLVALGCNANVLNMLGLKSIKEFRGLSFNDMAKIGNWPGISLQSFKTDSKEVLRTGKGKFNIEEPMIPDSFGKELYFLSSRVPILDRNEKVIGIVGISVDITERKKMEAELRLAKEKAEIANNAKTEFLSIVTHELRTPLNAVTGLTDYLLRHNELDLEKRKSILTTIQSSANNLTELVDNILDLSKLEAGKFTFYPQTFNLRAIVEEVTGGLAILAYQKHLDILVDFPGDIADQFVSDAQCIKRILQNLIGNAIKFTQTGQIIVAVEKTKALRKKSSLKISVSDTGEGIPKDKLDFIFEKFNQIRTSAMTKTYGTGLGLSIVKELVENLGGTFGVESELGVGSTFWFSLPYQAKSSLVRKASLLPEQTRILIIDDNLQRAKIMRKQLGLKAVDITNSKQVFKTLLEQLLVRKTYDFILVDDELEEMALAKLVKILKKQTQLATSKLILISKPIKYTEKQRMQKLGFTKCLTKPMQTSELILVLYNCVQEGSKG